MHKKTMIIRGHAWIYALRRQVDDDEWKCCNVALLDPNDRDHDVDRDMCSYE